MAAAFEAPVGATNVTSLAVRFPDADKPCLSGPRTTLAVAVNSSSVLSIRLWNIVISPDLEVKGKQLRAAEVKPQFDRAGLQRMAVCAANPRHDMFGTIAGDGFAILLREALDHSAESIDGFDADFTAGGLGVQQKRVADRDEAPSRQDSLLVGIH